MFHEECYRTLYVGELLGLGRDARSMCILCDGVKREPHQIHQQSFTPPCNTHVVLGEVQDAMEVASTFRRQHWSLTNKLTASEIMLHKELTTNNSQKY
jgi:hypothetical protein